jgi:hypothetical protein
MSAIPERPMDDIAALALVYGLAPVSDLYEAERAIAYLEARPWLLTNGEACRGLEHLRAMVGRYD